MKIKSTIHWPKGGKSSRFVELSNIDDRAQFERTMNQALIKGATVELKAIAIDPFADTEAATVTKD